MKTKTLRNLIGAIVAVAALHTAALAFAEQTQPSTAAAAEKMSDLSGTISAVDAANRTLTVKQIAWKRQFNLAADAKFVVGNNAEAKLADLKPGMEVKVTYQRTDGVNVARSVQQRQHTVTGSIKTMDAATQMVTLDRTGMARDFKLAPDHQLTLSRGQTGAFKDLKVGQRVKVHYVKQNGTLFAEKIEQPNATVTGTLQAVDAATGMVKTKHLLASKRFSLADDCKIVVNGNPEAKLRDLRLGEKVSIDYRDEHGVLIATRIAVTEGPQGTEAPVVQAYP
ncbi:MAG: DUF5666 domain-containing protein [Verrucomicrobiota bacterium]